MPRARNGALRRTAGVGIAAIATFTAGIATSPMASADVWDSVAICESGGNWAINTGNSFYGGLQFTRATWLGFGGGAYAPTANQASREQQIAIAKRVLAGQGPGAWPVCSKRAGLTRANGGAASGAAAPAASRSTTRVAPKATPSRATTAKKATAKVTVRKSTASTNRATSGTYTVKAGDTLSELAAEKHIAGGWRALYAANTSKISNPNLIYVGQVLKLPA